MKSYKKLIAALSAAAILATSVSVTSFAEADGPTVEIIPVIPAPETEEAEEPTAEATTEETAETSETAETVETAETAETTEETAEITVEEIDYSQYLKDELIPVYPPMEDGSEFVPDYMPKNAEALNYGNASSSYYNLVDEGRVSGIRNQNPWGTCWAHAALASAESNMITKGYANTSIDYSEAHLAWFGIGPGPSSTSDPLYGDSRGADDATASYVYNAGGLWYDSVGALSRWSGAELESVVPYSIALSGNAPAESTRYDSYATLTEATVYDPSDMTGIKNCLVKNGAMQISYYHDNTYYNSSTAAYYTTQNSSNHAVTLVGWDDNYAVTNFNSSYRPSSKGAWIVKNSWGSNWGDNGYFYISYEDASLRNFVSYEMEKKGTYNKLYQYDGSLGMHASGGYIYYDGYKSMSNATSANVFTATASDQLSKVGFYTTSAGVEYKVTVFTNVSSTPNTGKVAFTTSGTMARAGYHTVNVSGVTLTKGQKFAVAVTLYGSTYHCYDKYNNKEGISYYSYTTTPESSTSWYDAYTNRSASPCIKAYTKAAAVGTPTNVKAVAGDGQVTISWNAVPGASNYAVLMKKGTGWLTLGSTGTKTTYTATGLTNGGKYYFVVKAYGNGAWSDDSEIVYAIPVCTTPQNLKAVPGDSKVTLTWNAVSGASNYAIFLRKGTEWLKIGASGTSNTYTARGLTNGGKYFFMVKAYANGSWSDESATVSATPVCITPQNVKASAGDSKVTLTWNAVSGASNYAIFLRKGTEWLKIGASGTSNTYTARGLTNGGKYFFMVKAYANGSWSDESAIVSATPVCITPQNVKAVGGSGKATITWNAVSGASNYVVMVKKGTSWVTLGSTGTKTSYIATGLTSGGKYYFAVKAYVNGAWSDMSEPAAASIS